MTTTTYTCLEPQRMHKTFHKKLHHQPLRTHVKLEGALRNDVVKAGNNNIQVFYAITFRNEIIIFNTQIVEVEVDAA